MRNVIKNLSLSKKLTAIVLLFLLGLGAYVGKFHIVPAMKKAALTVWLNTPTELTIYEKNNHDDFSKTVIPLPQESGYLIAVYKDQHKLKLFRNNELVKEYDVNVRRELEDRKVWEDGQTPEGIFYIETMDKVSDPPWSRWIRLNTMEKARALYSDAYTDGIQLINSFEAHYGALDSDKKIRQFNQLHPSQNMLRGVGIHGGGFSLYHEWVEGCVALSDENVIELFDILKDSENGGIGIKVVIQD
ncbi:hypothetical protein BK004_01860 [bacterium CG10_46_32]|nr:MAG: hypothetical protein BK004_01860 [bacterium CG10_46_32]PIR56181.1 MAG: hypothetical protein COU73_01890 [Parcubacteria group bacterium CG10_big_fil_rev_8_21_14_0_10_46_32]